MAVQTRRQYHNFLYAPGDAGRAAFLGLGIAAFALFLSNIASTLSLRADGEDFGTTLLHFLDDYGIIVPLILIGIGYGLIRVGLSVLNRAITAAAWGRQILLWMLIASIVLAVQSFGQWFGNVDAFPALGGGILWLVIGAVLLLGYWWLGNNMHVFSGDETLAQVSSRTAWNLLLPTLIVLVLVAARPLEATFISSLTDERFASNQAVRFVGINNYAELLGIRFDVIGCTRGDDGACQTDDAGNLVFPRPRDALDPGYQELRYRDVTTIHIGESEFLLSGRDRDFINSIGNTLFFTVFSVVLELILGIFIAMVINSKFPGRGLMRTAMLVPWAIPTVVSARLWETMFRDNQSGVINNFFTHVIPVLSNTQAWLANGNLQLPALVAVDVWKTTPFMALILLAGLQLIPADIYEAADVDGASKPRQFFQITLPLLRPTIAVALVFRTLDSVRVFDVFQVLLGRQKLSMATYNYETLVQNQQLGYASAIGVVIFVIILIFAMTYVQNPGGECRMSAQTYTSTATAPSSGLTAKQVRHIAGQVGFWLLIIFILIYTLFPFYWAINSSFKGENEMFGSATYFPQHPTLINYQSVFSNDQFIKSLGNSTLVAGSSTLLALAVGAFAAYALGRIRFRGRTLMLYAVLAMTMFPQISILSGVFSVVQRLGLYGSQTALIVTYPIITLPFTVWTLTSFFKGLPGEIEQAALVDGATSFQTFYMILLPLTAPALVTTGLLAFIAAWNEYLFALTFTVVNPAAQTVTVAIALFGGQVTRQDPIAEIMAASVVVTIPLIALVLIFQRKIVEGLTAGAVKG